MVDWSLARQVANLSAGADDPDAYDVDLAAICAELEGPVAEYTGLELAEPVPAPELVSRVGVGVGQSRLARELLDPVAARLDDRLSFAGPLAGALRVGAAATVAAEAGLVMGYVSHRVLGQYEVSLLAGDRPPRLLFVAPNLSRAVTDMGVERSAFERWICAHELTHVFQFQGVPWLREHMSSLVRKYLESVEVRIDRGAAGGLPSMPNPSRLVETLPRRRPGGADPDARAALGDGEAADRHGGDRGSLRARDGFARRAPDPRPRHACAPPWPAAAAPARRPSAWWSGCSGWT